MTFDLSFWIQMLVYAVSFGTVYGSFRERLKAMDAKLEKHNQLVERTYHLESEVAVLKQENTVANHRIKDLEDLGKD